MIGLVVWAVMGQQNPLGMTLPGTAKVADEVAFVAPDHVWLGGLLGERYAANEHNRLPVVDEEELLAGFRHRPGKQAWIGEHVGKWLHAASLTYLAHHSSDLRAKMDRVVNGLLATQGPDRYLGTYPADKRFTLAPDADWDVWVHKYCMLGLLAYYQATHHAKALTSARRIGDLLIQTFRPGGQLLSRAGTHEGMAATSVLEPIVLLYRATADTRYLQFAKRIFESFNEPGGSHIERDLLATHSVAKTANGKAYEMLSNLVGLTELYRATDDARYLKPVQIAWSDIVKNRLYLTGTGSSMEHWTADGVLPNGNGDNVGETCVTVTWMQLNLEMLRLTGDSKYVDQVERSVYNHLLGSQRSDGAAWCYYSPLNGNRHPSSDTTCCLSSGPRGIALLPTFAYATRQGAIDVNLYGPSVYLGAVRLRQTGEFPFASEETITVEQGSPKPLTIRFRIPAWALGASLTVGKTAIQGVQPGTYCSVKRTWRTGDAVHLHLPMPVRTIAGVGNNAGYRAYMAGPVVYAADQVKGRFGVGDGMPKRIGQEQIEVPGLAKSINLVPFYKAGVNGARYAVWLPTQELVSSTQSLFAGGEESQSRKGNVNGSILDGDGAAYTVTFDGKSATEDWYAVTSPSAVTVSKIVFRHGMTFHDGGWFDTSAGKPQVQIEREAGGTWETIGALDSYPVTTAFKDPGLRHGQPFEFPCPPTKVFGIRIVGKPSSGDNSTQAFSSCGGLEAR